MSYRLPFRTILANGVNTNGNVDGSVTPVNFQYAPPAGKYVEVTALEGIFGANGSINNITDFLNIPALTNGIGVDIRTYGNNDFRPGAIKNNLNILQFTAGGFAEKAIGTLSLFIGRIDFVRPVILNAETGDYYRYIVSDNLTATSIINIIISGSIFTI